MNVKSSFWLPVALMLVFALTRWPGLLPVNFSAAYALAFCAGVYFSGGLAWLLPMVTLLVTDVLMNTLYYRVAPVNAYMLVNYAAYGLLIALGRRFSARASWIKLVGGSLIGAALFYLVTNSAAWLQNPGYAKTPAGWIQALTTGIPGYPPTWMFFWKTLLSGGLFTGLFVGSMKLGEATATKEKPAEEEAAPESGQAEESKA